MSELSEKEMRYQEKDFLKSFCKVFCNNNNCKYCPAHQLVLGRMNKVKLRDLIGVKRR